MTQAQWDAHDEHFKSHVTKWPATKEEIIAACNGMDVEPAVLEEVKNLSKAVYASPEELKAELVK